MLGVGEDTRTCPDGSPMIMRSSSEPLNVDVNADAPEEIVLVSVVVRYFFIGLMKELEVLMLGVGNNEPGSAEDVELVTTLPIWPVEALEVDDCPKDWVEVETVGSAHVDAVPTVIVTVSPPFLV